MMWFFASLLVLVLLNIVYWVDSDYYSELDIIDIGIISQILLLAFVTSVAIIGIIKSII